VAATVTAQRWDMTFTDSFQPPPGGSTGIGASITGHGTTNLDPFAMVAYATVPGFGQVTTMMSGSLIWEFGAGNYGISAGPEGAPGASIAGFAPLVEGTLGAEDGAVAMLGLGSSTGYLNLVQAAISGATRTGPATVDGVAVTLYRVTVDPTRLASAPGITPGESAAVADALRLLAQDGSPPMTDTLAVDDSGRIREIDQVVTFADGAVATQHTTLSNFDCAPTVVLPGTPPPAVAGPCGTPPVTAPLPTPPPPSPPSQSSTTPAVGATATSPNCGLVAFTATASSQGAFDITESGTDCPTARSVAGAARGHNGTPYSFGAFTCPQGTASPPSGIAYFTYRCASTTASVTFAAQG
jgi:hypothetical protein